MKPAPVFETSVRELGECGGHFWAPAYGEPEELNGCQPLGECGGHFWAPAFEEPEELNGCPRRPRT